jgi:transcription elongation factor S-II
MKLKNPEKFRKNITDKITLLLGDEKRAINLEKGIYNYTIKNCDEKNIVKKWDNRHFAIIYIDKVRTIFNNINNKYIQDLLKEKKIKIHKLAFMTHQELEPDKWKQLIEDKKLRDDNKYEPKLEASTDDFKCWKCKSKKCTYYQLQTRSADEPMTTFVTCLNCGQRWKC